MKGFQLKRKNLSTFSPLLSELRSTLRPTDVYSWEGGKCYDSRNF